MWACSPATATLHPGISHILHSNTSHNEPNLTTRQQSDAFSPWLLMLSVSKHESIKWLFNYAALFLYKMWNLNMKHTHICACFCYKYGGFFLNISGDCCRTRTWISGTVCKTPPRHLRFPKNQRSWRQRSQSRLLTKCAALPVWPTAGSGSRLRSVGFHPTLPTQLNNLVWVTLISHHSWTQGPYHYF